MRIRVNRVRTYRRGLSRPGSSRLGWRTVRLEPKRSWLICTSREEADESGFQVVLLSVNMANAVASYDQLAHQVEVLRKENSHLRRELEDNSNHLSKLETETFGMKEVLKQLQSKLDQEAGTLASSGRSDVLHQLKELHMDLTNYYELKHQPHNLRLLLDSSVGSGVPEMEDRLALPPSSCSSSSSVAAVSRARSPLRPLSRQSAASGGVETAAVMLPPHFLDGAPPKTAVITGADGRLSDHHMEELYKERNLLLGEIDREERERCWYFSQLEALSQKLAQLPRIDTFTLQMDRIRQQLEFEAQQVRSVMEERFGTSDEMVQRTQMRVARLEQLEKELQEARGSQESQLQFQATEIISSSAILQQDESCAVDQA
ncbi:Adenomatous polyposis protein [Channa argus]|uniref:Adenomatous polyposis protein n=1 Tax=Channa argus TaxID=215402 RepID=A0A6G1PJY3_CHAAH|nr:Adenomatous polyposis protein [Channa argus]